MKKQFLSISLLFLCLMAGVISSCKKTKMESGTIAYATAPYTYYVGTTIAPIAATLTGDKPSGFSISPALSAGLIFDTTVGLILGTPTAIAPATTYTITANYQGGKKVTSTVSINVLATPTLAYTGSPFTYTAGVAITALTATLNDPNPVSFAVNPALPAGLTLNTTTGAISGTPTKSASATDYTITTTYVGGAKAVATINVTVLRGVSTFAGSGVAISTDGTGTAAAFNNPQGVAVDAAGNVYVADVQSSKIRKITPAGVVTTFAGSGSVGAANGTGTAASFKNPSNLTADATGNVYVADFGNNLIRKITSAGVVTTFAGSGAAGSANGTGTAASFNGPSAVAVDAAGNVYVVDRVNNLIRKITSAGVVSTFAGSGAQGSADGTGVAATFKGPSAIAIDASGNLYVTDSGNNLIRKITSAGVVTTFAGSGAVGSANGTGTAASFNFPIGICLDAAGNVYVADTFNSKIRKITSAGVVTTLAGIDTTGSTNGSVTVAKFNLPYGIAVDTEGNVYVGDQGNNLIRKIAQ